MEKYRIALPIAVEGKYDKNTLMQIFDATVIYVGGFGIFNSKEKQALIRRVAVNGMIPKDKIYNVYIPRIEGKERRKSRPSKAGTLGVEGMDRETLLRVLAPFIVTANDGTRVTFSAAEKREMLTKVDFYQDGLTGGENSSRRRDMLAAHFGLPSGMTPNALLEALNIITDREGYRAAVDLLFN